MLKIQSTLYRNIKSSYRANGGVAPEKIFTIMKITNPKIKIIVKTIKYNGCEDNLTDEKYFNEAYEEACQLTAYLCAMYGINPQGSVQFNGITVPTILCHADSHQLGLGSNHSDIYNWFPKFDKDMNDVRRDVAAIMASNSEQIYNDQDDEDMTQEKFNEMMQNYLNELSEEPATWENAAMQWAVQNGLLQGDEHGRLMPKKFMTRGEFMTVLQRYDNQK